MSQDAHPLDAAGVPGRVSIIVPTHNRASLVLQALDSLRTQQPASLAARIEAVVVDDGSDDDTGERLRDWARRHPDFRLVCLRQENGGTASARNRGLRHASGEFVGFLDSDDLLLPDAIDTHLGTLADPTVAYSIGHIRSTDLAGDEVDDGGSGRSRVSPDRIIPSHWMVHAALYRRSALAAVGPFCESLARGEDTELIWRLVSRWGAGAELDRTVGLRRVHGQSHLSVDRSPAQQQQDTLDALLVYFAWSDARGLPRMRMRRGMQLHFLAVAIRYGVIRAEEGRKRARRLSITLAGPRTLAARLSAALVGPDSRPYPAHVYYCVLWMLYCQLYRLRARLRALRERGRVAPKTTTEHA